MAHLGLGRAAWLSTAYEAKADVLSLSGNGSIDPERKSLQFD
jgi:hypothetical protein